MSNLPQTANNGNFITVFHGDIDQNTEMLCNARDLHKFLNVGRDFNTWVKDRIKQYGFVKGQDFVIVKNTFPQNGGKVKMGRPTVDYHITLDMAKELAMIENNEQGRKVRRYFINCEKRLYQIAVSGADTLLTQNQTLKTELLKANSDYNAIKVMYDGGLENWQIGMAVNLSRHTISKRLTHLRKLGLLDDERGKHTPSEQLVQSVDATNTQLTLGV